MGVGGSLFAVETGAEVFARLARNADVVLLVVDGGRRERSAWLVPAIGPGEVSLGLVLEL